MQAFLEKVFLFSYFPLLHNGNVQVLQRIYANVQHKFDKARAFRRVHGTAVGIELMIVDILEGLLISMVSSPATSI
jgi:hypothetical protein